MKALTFYEKPECINNRRQRRLLEEQGCILERRNVLNEAWTRQSLAPFFTHHSDITDWFNKSSPRIKSGEIKPHLLSADDALDVMIDDPLLIHRPLIAFNMGNKIFRCCGFDYTYLNSSLGLNLHMSTDSDALLAGGIETCPRVNRSIIPANGMTISCGSA
jgi:nitrogenase-associated protein